MGTEKNKVTYGLWNVIVWPITSTSDDGVPTYGEKFKVPGAVNLSLKAEGSTDSFYADNATYVSTVTNNGYSGDLTIADVPEDFRVKILKEIKDKNGVIFESSEAKPAEFAMACEFEGDINQRRHVFYRCLATRPDISSATIEEKKKYNEAKLSFSAKPRLDTRIVKASAEQSDAGYNSLYGEKPYEKDSTVTPGH